jgi:hypothetical protein
VPKDAPSSEESEEEQEEADAAQEVSEEVDHIVSEPGHDPDFDYPALTVKSEGWTEDGEDMNRLDHGLPSSSDPEVVEVLDLQDAHLAIIFQRDSEQGQICRICMFVSSTTLSFH